MIRRLRFDLPRCLSLSSCVAVLALGACGPDDVGTDDAGETTNASDSDDGADEASTDGAEDASTTDDGSFIQEDGPGEESSSTPGNLGDPCADDSQCAEDLVCNAIPMIGGICSECSSDADCDGGNCTFNGMWFECGDGSLGQMCESDESCSDGLYCAEILDTGGLFALTLCSECAEDSHCPDGQLCAPEFDLMSISGSRNCIDPGTLAQDAVCDADGAGDEQCGGFCTTASLMGILDIGVCGECESDADCMDMQSCAGAMAGFDGFSGSTCG